MIDFVVAEDEARQRVDVVVATKIDAGRSVVQAALRGGLIKVNGKVARPSLKLAPGDRVAGEVPEVEGAIPGAEEIPLTVRYDDKRVLVVSKPVGLVTHPSGGHRTGTLVNALLALPGPLSRLDPERPGIVHRLDRDTSGLVLVARDEEAHRFLQGALKARRMKRGYLAIVRGVPDAATGTIEAPIGRHPTRRTRMAVVTGGRPAVTHYRVLSSTAEASLLDVTLETGRTHQIRVHLARIGHPVLGDRTYGGMGDLARRLGATRQMLQAVRLEFPHPDDERAIEVTDEIAPDLVEVCAAAGLEIS